MLKNINKLFIVIAFFTAFNLFADEERFIELEVTDTVNLKATQLVYQISIGNKTEFMGISIDDKDSENDTLPSLQSVTAILDKANIKYSVDITKDYSIAKKPVSPTIEITLNNAADLNKLYNLVRDIKGVTGKIKKVDFEPMSKYYSNVYKSLYNKAMVQANLLTNVAGTSLGKLISISEIKKNEADNYMSFFKQMMKSMPLGMYGDIEIKERSEEIKMIFKFEIK